MKKFFIACTIFVSVVLISCILYFSNHFFPGTTINEIDVSCLNANDAYLKLCSEHNIEFADEIENFEFNTSDFLSYGVTADDFKSVLNKNKFKSNNITIDLKTAIDSEYLLDNLNEHNESRTSSENAYIKFDKENFNYVIVPETYGNKLDTAGIVLRIKSIPTTQIDLTEFYLTPTVLKDDEKLNEELKESNKLFDTKITLDLLDDEKLVIDKNTFKDWLIINDQEVSFNDENLQKFVEDLSKKVNTVGNTRSVNTQSGLKEISGGTYGWKLDEEAEANQLKEDILNHNSTTRRPVFEQEAVVYSKNDLGNTFIEVDIDNQHLYYIEDGEVKLDSDVVTGQLNKKDRHTTTGTHFIWTKNENRYLNGPTWHCFVNRFMPFCGGQGFHDASWRSSFGGQIYKTNGSHGCINMPKAKVLELYDLVDIGCPVVIYSSNY